MFHAPSPLPVLQAVAVPESFLHHGMSCTAAAAACRSTATLPVLRPLLVGQVQSACGRTYSLQSLIHEAIQAQNPLKCHGKQHQQQHQAAKNGGTIKVVPSAAEAALAQERAIRDTGVQEVAVWSQLQGAC
jgi:hypothetical protein